MRTLLTIVLMGLVAFATPLRADDVKESSMDTTAFAADLYGQLAAKKGNLFFSPFSIETALAMTYAGANGNTAEQMGKTLHFAGGADGVSASFSGLLKKLNNPPEVFSAFDDAGKPVKKPAFELTAANALWGQQGYSFLPGFTDDVKRDYAGGLHSVDYGQPEVARKTINDWVASQTKDKIKDLVARGMLNPATRLILTNAIYFKSNWESKFQKAATKDGPFTTSVEATNNVPLMHQRHDFGYMETADLQLVELPYMLRELSMVVLLPTKVNGLPGLEKNLSSENLRNWIKAAQSESVELTLPKFTFSADLQLTDTLRAMGMADPFDPNKADFSRMSTTERFFISAVIHKAFIAVDEEGTEAAAATAIAMVGSVAIRQAKVPKIFKADHPFLFLIRHNATGEILFLGRVTEPKGN